MTKQLYKSDASNFEIQFAEDGLALDAVTEAVTGCFVFAFDESNRLLMIRNKRGWDIPGGHVETGEHVIATAQRETLEEAALTVKDLAFFCFNQKQSYWNAIFHGAS